MSDWNTLVQSIYGTAAPREPDRYQPGYTPERAAAGVARAREDLNFRRPTTLGQDAQAVSEGLGRSVAEAPGVAQDLITPRYGPELLRRSLQSYRAGDYLPWLLYGAAAPFGAGADLIGMAPIMRAAGATAGPILREGMGALTRRVGVRPATGVLAAMSAAPALDDGQH